LDIQEKSNAYLGRILNQILEKKVTEIFIEGVILFDPILEKEKLRINILDLIQKK